jgi:hypothetical protein
VLIKVEMLKNGDEEEVGERWKGGLKFIQLRGGGEEGEREEGKRRKVKGKKKVDE